MQMATGTITTVASQLKGGVLADEIVLSESFIPTNPMRIPSDGGIAPPSPLSETWDLWVVMALICTIYVLYHRYSLKKQ